MSSRGYLNRVCVFQSKSYQQANHVSPSSMGKLLEQAVKYRRCCWRYRLASSTYGLEGRQRDKKNKIKVKS
jgi:hypothetical protein